MIREAPGFIGAAARSLLAANDAAVLVPTFTGADDSFSLDDAWRVADEIRRRRMAAGDTARGYKIGFTNRGIWARYGVHAPIWGPIWNSTLEFAPSRGEAVVSLAPFTQPRLEPEVVFSFATAPRAGMSEHELARCIDWVAHGFEIVHTHFDGWRFQAADTVADFALHGRLFVGARVPLATFADPVGELAAIEVTLCCDDRDIETGRGSIVLDGPLTALRLWVDAMAAQPQRWPIERGDIVTTGTITDAAPMAPGERWHTRLSDPRLAGLALRTTA
ncbi:MAG: hypothetical protein ABIO71_13065 [Caldimonas sp.]